MLGHVPGFLIFLTHLIFITTLGYRSYCYVYIVFEKIEAEREEETSSETYLVSGRIRIQAQVWLTSMFMLITTMLYWHCWPVREPL